MTFPSKSQILNPKSRPRGFSLLELLIVIAIMGVLAAAGSGFYGSIVKNVEIQSVSKTLASDLRSVRSKSMIGEFDNGVSVKWGAHLVNVAGGSQYYELFSTPTTYADLSKNIVSTTTLPFGINFSSPGDNTTMDIIFSTISGTTTPRVITITSPQGTSETLNVTSIGSIN